MTVVLCSIERLLDELSESACLALDPLQITECGMLTVSAECQSDPKSLFTLIYVQRSVSTADKLHFDSSVCSVFSSMTTKTMTKMTKTF